MALFGQFGNGNLGNDTSLLAAARKLRELDHRVSLSCLCNAPEEVERLYGIPADAIRRHTTAQLAVHRPVPVRVGRRVLDFVRMLLLMRRVDVLLVPGTGLLEAGSKRAGSFVSTLLMTTLAARLSGASVALVSVGLDLGTRKATNTVLRWTMRLANFRSFRDLHSQRAARKLGVKPTAPRPYPDLVFGLDTTPSVTPGETEIRSVGVGVMDYRAAFFGDNPTRRDTVAEEYLTTIVRFASWLLDRELSVVLLTGATKDEAIAENVVERLTTHDNGANLEIGRSRSIDDLLDYMRHVDYVVATRYHNVVAATLIGKPVISISYGPKNSEVLTALSLGRFKQDIDKLDVGRLREQSLELEQCLREVSLRMKLAVKEYRKLVDQQWMMLATTVLEA